MEDKYLVLVNDDPNEYVVDKSVVRNIITFDHNFDLASSNAYLVLDNKRIFIRDIVSFSPIAS